ncbi:MAG TPA: hypothetical protein VMP08_06670 [Anaerolineae bacterium]|nr:hypothetical protein [Anaerolineae bacterium]
MQQRTVLLSVGACIAMLALVLSPLAFAQGTGDNQPGASAAPNTQGDDSNPIGKPEVVIPETYRPSAADLVQAQAATETAVYFTPQDENTSTTVLFLYNTNPATATVGLQTFYINGSLTLSTTVAVPPLGLVRICADTVSTVSASWANSVLINFTTFSAYAKMMVPQGVKADGYVAWDVTGVYDPLTNTQTLPLRFSTDPATVFLPSVAR